MNLQLSNLVTEDLKLLRHELQKNSNTSLAKFESEKGEGWLFIEQM